MIPSGCSKRRQCLCFGGLILALCLISCSPRTIPAPSTTPKPLAGTYLDLEPGWRLRVITPLLRGGGFVLKPIPLREDGSTIALQASNDFEGYETSFYEVLPPMRLRFQQATATREGITAPAAKPSYALSIPGGMKFARLVYLKRGSEKAHDMAILAARHPAELDALTFRLQSSPASDCGKGCQWVPVGIAVRAEQQKNGQWAPVR